jgi:hypothetical protein
MQRQAASVSRRQPATAPTSRRAWINDERSHRCARRLARPRDALRTPPCVVGSPLLPAHLSPLASALRTFHSSLVTLSGRKPTSHVSPHDPTPTPTSPPLYALYIPRHDVLSVVGVAPLPLVSDPLAPSSITPTPPRCVPALPPHSTRSASHTFPSPSRARSPLFRPFVFPSLMHCVELLRVCGCAG